MKLLITGSRDLTRVQSVEEVLNVILKEQGGYLYLILGDCPTGADHFAKEWADNRRVHYLEFKADWDAFGKGAGPLRNQLMVDQKPDLAFAFTKMGSGNKGTLDTVRRCNIAGIPVKMFIENIEGDGGYAIPTNGYAPDDQERGLTQGWAP